MKEINRTNEYIFSSDNDTITQTEPINDVPHSDDNHLLEMEIIFNSIHDIICVVDPATCKTLYSNKAFNVFFPEYNHQYSSCSTYLLDSSKNCTNCPIRHLYQEENISAKPINLEVYRPSENIWLSVEYSLITWTNGKKVVFIKCTDITSQKMQEIEMRNLAYQDPLLKIPNRLQFNEDMNAILKQGHNGAIILMDIDNFKNVNDTFGHSYGDLLLKSVSEFLNSLASSNCSFYRYGGDEFMIIINQADEQAVYELCSQLHHRFTLPWRFGLDSQYYTSSIGVAFYPKDGSTVDTIIRSSDIALFSSKNKSKNTVSYYSQELNDSFSNQVRIEDCLRFSVLNSLDEFELYYQPIMNIVTNKCIGVEALVRWNNKELGLVSPNQFIHLAENLGLIVQLGEWLFETACKQLKEWNPSLSRDFKMNINVSNRQLQTNNFLDMVKNVIENNKISSRTIVIEVAECIDPNEVGAISGTLADLKKLGVTIAMDDFGTGYSSLNNIMDPSIDIIKIDKTFINNITTDRMQVTFVRSITNLSQIMHKKISIEGVETKEQLEIIKNMGSVSIVQGYYFSKPLPAHQFTEWFLKYHSQ